MNLLVVNHFMDVYNKIRNEMLWKFLLDCCNSPQTKYNPMQAHKFVVQLSDAVKVNASYYFSFTTMFHENIAYFFCS